MAKLVCRSGPSAGHEYPITKDKILCGRQRTCDIQILDSMASREHFLIRRDGNLYTLIDLESRNGTHLNNRKVSERQLDFGDRITIGEVEYVFVKEEGDLEIQDLLIEHYEILEKLGEGGMGVVYKANQRSMDRIVALKILSPKFSSRQRFVEQFVREARAAGQLNHSNIIQVHDVASENGLHYFSMEYVDGISCLDILTTKGPVPAAATLEIARQTCKALEYAHEHHLIHRDVKPENIMLTSNNMVKVADLGISKTFEEAEAEGSPKRIVGTPHYMAPEAALGNRIDHRVDIYSLGATLYHLLTGRTPFSGSTPNDILKGHIKEPPAPPAEVNPEIPAEVGDLVERMMSKDPEERPAQCGDVLAEIHAIQQRQATAHGGFPGEETVLLQKLAKSSRETLAYQRREEKAGDGDQEVSAFDEEEDGNEEEGTSRFAQDNGATQQEQEREVQDLHMVQRILIGAIVLVLGVIVWEGVAFAMDVLDDSPPASGNGTSETNGGEDPDASGNGDEPEEDAASARRRLIRERDRLIAALETSVLEDDVDLDAVDRRQRELLELSDLTSAQRTRLEQTGERIAAMRANQQSQRERAAYKQLRDRVDALKEAHDYPAALKAIADARSDFSDAFSARLDAIAQEVNGAREIYLDGLDAKRRSYEARQDVDALVALRAEVPGCLADESAVKQIDRSIEEVREAKRRSQEETVAEFVAAARSWNLDHFADLVENKKARITNPDTLAQIEEIEGIAAVFRSAIPLMNEGIRRYGGEFHYHDTLGEFENPVLLSVNQLGFEVKMSDSARADIRLAFSTIPVDKLKTIITMMVADRERSGRVIEAIDRLEALAGQ